MSSNVESNKEKISGLYEELKGLFDSIPNDRTWFDDNGFVDSANKVISRVESTCPEIEDPNQYLLKKEYINGRGDYVVNVIPSRSKLSALIGRLKGTYSLEAPTANNSHTFIQSQSQSQYLNIVLEFQEKIISKIPDYPKGSKERNFLEKLKEALPTIKNMTDIIALILKIGSNLKLDLNAIHKILGL